MGEAGAEGGGTTGPDVACIGGHWASRGSDGIIISGGDKMTFGRIRPQIFLALFLLGVITMFAIYKDVIPVATGTIGGMVALGMKVLEVDNND